MNTNVCTILRYALPLALGVFLATSGDAQQSPPAPPAAKPAKASKKATAPVVEPVLEPKAMEILKATSAYAMGAIYATLPNGCALSTAASTSYYHCGTTWFQPSYGANGIYYRVVPTP